MLLWGPWKLYRLKPGWGKGSLKSIVFVVKFPAPARTVVPKAGAAAKPKVPRQSGRAKAKAKAHPKAEPKAPAAPKRRAAKA